MSNQLLDKMNVFLANQEISHIKLHNLHWYVKGHGFFTLHTKLEELYNESADIIDDVAERILAIGGSPVASLKEALALATIKELESKAIPTAETVQVLLNDVEWWIKDSQEIATLANESNDVVTADLFTGYVKDYEKIYWMLQAYNA